jgi:hypothetical protein
MPPTTAHATAHATGADATTGGEHDCAVTGEGRLRKIAG